MHALQPQPEPQPEPQPQPGGDPNALCTALRLRKQWLLSAYCTGHVRLHDVLSKSLVVQVLQPVVSSKMGEQ